MAVTPPPTSHVLAEGSGWHVRDVHCHYGPSDRPFEERHAAVCIGLVVSGSFTYRASAHPQLMTPGSLLLGSPGQTFLCAHEHSAGDHCLDFSFTPAFFEQIASGAVSNPAHAHLPAARIPALPALSPFAARAAAALASPAHAPWEELALSLAAQTLRLAHGLPGSPKLPPASLARITRVLRHIERHPAEPHTLAVLAAQAGLSPYHFLRTFQLATGVTPHQYVRRLRLRQAATRLALERTTILNIALEAGFEDLSTFNRAFRAEFQTSPRTLR